MNTQRLAQAWKAFYKDIYFSVGSFLFLMFFLLMIAPIRSEISGVLLLFCLYWPFLFGHMLKKQFVHQRSFIVPGFRDAHSAVGLYLFLAYLVMGSYVFLLKNLSFSPNTYILAQLAGWIALSIISVCFGYYFGLRFLSFSYPIYFAVKNYSWTFSS
jgi:hypothetical protein